MSKIHIHSANIGSRQWCAQFAILLDSIVTTPSPSDANYVLESLNRQADFVATMIGVGPKTGIELRIKCTPNQASPYHGKIDVAMRVSAQANTKKAAHQRALLLFDEVLPHLVGLSEEYSWAAIETEDAFKEVFHVDGEWQVAELTRREGYLSIDRSTEQRERRGIGFITGPDVTTPPPNHPYVCFPYIRSYDRWRDLFIELLHQKEPVLLSVCLWPTRATMRDKEFLFEQILHCERFMQLPVSGPVGDLNDFYPALRGLAHVVRDHTQKVLLSLQDDVYVGQVLAASQAPISRLLLESMGVAITEHVSTSDPASDAGGISREALGGGFQWTHAKDEADRVRTIDQLELLAHAGTDKQLDDPQYRIRRLFDIPQANCIFRLPVPSVSTFPGLKTRLYSELPPPPASEQTGLFFGRNHYRSNREAVHMLDQDRLRHTYIIGMTGTGKSTLLKNLILQDISNGKGTGVFDPHGELIDEILPYIPANRWGDVHVIRPSDDNGLFGLNILEVQSDKDKDAAINFLLEVFGRLYNMSEAGGPMFELYFRNGMLLLMSDREATHTLMDFERLFISTPFRREKLAKCKDERVRDFWLEVAEKRQGEQDLANISAYITSKLTRMTSSILIRKIISQRKSTIDFESILNDKKILLVDLSKGQLGDTNSAFLGMLLLKRIQQTAFGRRKKAAVANPFHIYVDEFQNLATDSFLAMLSEGRKYGLAITLANQYLDQIPDAIRDSIIGNVGSLVSFRLGYNDAELMSAAYGPMVDQSDLASIPNYHAYIRFLVRGNASDPTNIVTENTTWERFSPSTRG